MTRPIYLSKALNIASSNVFGSLSSAATPVLTLLTSITLDTPRRIQFASSANISSAVVFVVTGTIEGGGTKTEQIFSSTGAAITTLDFLTIKSVSISTNSALLPITIGTNNTGGTRWMVMDQILGGTIAGDITFSSSGNGMTGSMEWTLDDPTGYYPITNPGNPYPQPTVLVSSVLSAVTGQQQGPINIDGQVPIPAYAVRLTITSSSSGAGTVYATVLQSGSG